MPPRILALVGPTASGKTATSVHLAHRLHGEIVSADSRQVYKYLDIGTAKPTREEMGDIPHHFIDILPPDAEFNAGMFGEQGRQTVMEILGRGRLPIVVGGSGLYVKSLIDGLFEGPGADPDFREAMEERLQSGEFATILDELRKVDPVAAATIDPTKPRRIIRALEVYYSTGIPLSELHHQRKPVIPFEAVQVGLLHERSVLYERINARCDAMLEAGLLEEIDKLAAMGYDRRLNALNTVGYAEGFAYKAGEIPYEEMLRLFKQNTRRYAKRQMTWFRGDKRVEWVEAGEDAGVTAERVEAVFRRGSA